MSAPYIRDMNPNDLQDVTLIHQQAFPNFFMTLLGSPFLSRYYLTVLEYEKSISLVYVDASGNTIGFAVGFLEPSNFYKFLREKIFQFLLPTLNGLVRKPYLLKNILAGFLRVNKSKPGNSAEGSCELSSIGVAKKGTGIGKVLLRRFVELCFLKGAKNLMLTTDLHNNDSVIGFYKSEGFMQAGIDVRGNREMIQLMLRNPN